MKTPLFEKEITGTGDILVHLPGQSRSLIARDATVESLSIDCDPYSFMRLNVRYMFSEAQYISADKTDQERLSRFSVSQLLRALELKLGTRRDRR